MIIDDQDREAEEDRIRREELEQLVKDIDSAHARVRKAFMEDSDDYNPRDIEHLRTAERALNDAAFEVRQLEDLNPPPEGI